MPASDSGFELFLVVILFLGCLLGPSVITGIYGNRWRKNSIKRRGYKYLSTVNTETPEGAIAAVCEKPQATDTI